MTRGDAPETDDDDVKTMRDAAGFVVHNEAIWSRAAQMSRAIRNAVIRVAAFVVWLPGSASRLVSEITVAQADRTEAGIALTE